MQMAKQQVPLTTKTPSFDPIFMLVAGRLTHTALLIP